VTTFILTWDGSDSAYTADFAEDVEATAIGALVRSHWSIGTRTGGLSKDDRVFLLRQGTDRGILASRRITDPTVFQAEHWNDPSRTANYVPLEWDRVLPVENRLPTGALGASPAPLEQHPGFWTRAPRTVGRHTRDLVG
jgi:hypothetical protein